MDQALPSEVSGEEAHGTITSETLHNGENKCNKSSDKIHLEDPKDNNMSSSVEEPKSSRHTVSQSDYKVFNCNGAVKISQTNHETNKIKENSVEPDFVVQLRACLLKKEEEVEQLKRTRTDMEAELEDLTGSLFEEAHRMVQVAKTEQASCEKTLVEKTLQIEGLLAEVGALKTLVLTSTPSQPNFHLHPHIANGGGLLGKNKLTHRRSPSHSHLSYGRDPPSPEEGPTQQQIHEADVIAFRDTWDLDPIFHSEFVTWRDNPTADITNRECVFLSRIMKEDVQPCLTFPNKELAAQVMDAVLENGISMEADRAGAFPRLVTLQTNQDELDVVIPRRCALLDVPRLCPFRLRLGDDSAWIHISAYSRNRIAAVCNFVNYLRYVEQGLVKSPVVDVYWEIIRLRRDMLLARLGAPDTQNSTH